MPAPKTRQVIRQRPWTPAELRASGFRYYVPRKRLTMARRLPASEAPMTIKTSWDTIVAQAGYYIAYVAGDKLKKSLNDYQPRPIEPQIFEATYAPWDEPNWKPSPTEAHLLKLGARPYYKTAGVWARQLKEPTWVQSMESEEPSLAPPGAWLCIGTAGEPWTVDDDWFEERYLDD